MDSNKTVFRATPYRFIMKPQQTMRFRLDISAEKYQSYYQGQAKFVLVTAEDGRSLKFPASELQRFVTHSGVQGRFEICFDENFKLQQIRRIS